MSVTDYTSLTLCVVLVVFECDEGTAVILCCIHTCNKNFKYKTKYMRLWTWIKLQTTICFVRDTVEWWRLSLHTQVPLCVCCNLSVSPSQSSTCPFTTWRPRNKTSTLEYVSENISGAVTGSWFILDQQRLILQFDLSRVVSGVCV